MVGEQRMVVEVVVIVLQVNRKTSGYGCRVCAMLLVAWTD